MCIAFYTFTLSAGVCAFLSACCCRSGRTRWRYSAKSAKFLVFQCIVEYSIQCQLRSDLHQVSVSMVLAHVRISQSRPLDTLTADFLSFSVPAAPHHEIVYPWLAHPVSGHFVSHDVNARRKRRSVSDEEGEESVADLGILSIKFRGLGEDFHVKVKQNERLMPSTFHVVARHHDGSNVTISMSEDFACHHHGIAVSHDHSPVAMSNCDGLVGDVMGRL